MMIVNDKQLKPQQKEVISNKTLLLAWRVFDYLIPLILLFYAGYLVYEESVNSFNILIVIMAFVKLYVSVQKQNRKYEEEDGLFSEI